MATYAEIKAALEAQGVVDETVITTVKISADKPVFVLPDPSVEGAYKVVDTYAP